MKTKSTIGLMALFTVSSYAGEMHAPAPQSAAATNSGDFFTGANAREDAWYAYAGSNYMFNRDTSASGFFVHGMTGYGEYEYDTLAGGVDGEVTELDLGLGYQWFAAGHRFSVIAAFNYADHDLSGTPFDLANNSVNGSETGFKPKFDIWNTDASTVLYGGTFTYSTAYDSYWNRVMCGLNIGGVYLGPELIIQGNDEYEEIRTGLTLAGVKLGIADLGASLGYAWADPKAGSDEQEGIYGALHLNFPF